MGRTDARALEVPEPPPTMPVATADHGETAAAAALQLTLRPRASQPQGAPTQNAPVAAAPSRCPHCKAGLSAIEQKFGRCMGCGSEFGQASSASINIGL